MEEQEKKPKPSMEERSEHGAETAVSEDEERGIGSSDV